MKRIVIPVVVVFLCGLALVVVWSKSGTASREQQIAVVESGVSAATQQVDQPVISTNNEVTPQTTLTEPTQVAVSSGPSSLVGPRALVAIAPTPAGKPQPPASLTGFWGWPTDHRERVVTTMQSEPSWPADVREFILKAVQDNSLSPVTRNNMAVGLFRQEPHVLGIHAALMRMANDPNEEPVWRDYTLQFLAQEFPRSSEQEQRDISHTLTEAMTTQKGPAVGTALLQLSRLAEELQMPLDDRYDAQVLTIIEDDQQMESNRSTALAVLGQRGYAPVLPVARAVLATSTTPGVKRAAIGVLNLLGDATDLESVKKLIMDADPSVRLVAKQAAQALERRLTADVHP